MLVHEVTKMKFVYTGEKSTYITKWHNTNVDAERNSSGLIHWIIKKGGERVDVYSNDINYIVEYAKRSVYARGAGANVEGNVRVYIRDAVAAQEILALTVKKWVHRYYEPVDRFKHDGTFKERWE